MFFQWLSRFRKGPLTTVESGRAAQAFIERKLKRDGYRVVARNVSDDRGELDLVLRHKDFDGVIVVEVRSFAANTPLRQEEILPPSKQQQVIETARRLLPRIIKSSRGANTAKHNGAQALGAGIRFDAALVALDPVSGRPVSMEHFVNAFTSERRDWF